MPKRNNRITKAQAEELKELLTWDSEEFDVLVLDGPHPENSEGRWRVRVILGKRSVIVYQPERGHIKLDARSVMKKGRRPSTGTSDIDKAIQRAQKFLLNLRIRRVAADRLDQEGAQVHPDDVSVGLIHDLFRSHALEGFEPKFQNNLTLVMDLVEHFAGRGFHPLDIDAKWVEDVIEWRTKNTIKLPRVYPDGTREVVELEPVEAVTALANVRDYDRVLQFAYGFRRGRRKARLLDPNPLREIKQWPTYQKSLRERASDELYELLMTPTRITDAAGDEVILPAPVDAADRSGLGIVRCVTAVKYHTARRREAVLGLRCGDILTSPREVRRVLRKLGGAHRSDWAEEFPHGVLVFRAELDKNGYGRAFPMSRILRSHIDAHLARLKAAGYSTEGAAPLFPRPTSAHRSASVNTLYRVRSVRSWQLRSGEVRTRDRKGGWYTEALYLARSYLERQGLDPDRIVPTDPDDPSKILGGFKAHAWRRLWATKLERLGYGKNTSTDDFDLDRHTNFMGSWTILGGGIREERYIELDPRVLMAIASFEDGTRFLKDRARFEEKRTSDLMKRVMAAAPTVAPGEVSESA